MTRWAARRERYAATRGRVPRLGVDYVVTVEQCSQCRMVRESCDETEATVTTSGPCISDEHTWIARGRRSVTGLAPWLAHVPGMIGPGVHSLPPGSEVFVGPRRVVVPQTGTLVVTRTSETTLSVFDGFDDVDDNGVIRQRAQPPRSRGGAPVDVVTLYETRGRGRPGGPAERPLDFSPD